MMRRWTIALMVLLAFALLGSSGCKRVPKKPGTLVDPNMGMVDGRTIVGWNPDGTPIYSDDPNALGFRPEGPEMGLGQFEPVYFDYDSPQLNPAEMGKIDMVVSYLQSNPTHGVIVEAHCDERGSNEYNLALGERRALAVRAAIISKDIDAMRVLSRSYGEERAVAFGHDESSWRLNRRAEFAFTQM